MAGKTIPGVRNSPVHRGQGGAVPVRSNTSEEVAPRRTIVRSDVFELEEGSGDRDTATKNPRKHVGSGPLAFCADCVNLLFLDGVPKCAEHKFLIWPDALLNGIQCKKQMRYDKLPHFKVFNGSANNAVAVVEELVLEAMVSLCVVRNRYVTASEITQRIKKMHKFSLFPVLNRLSKKDKIITDICLVYHPLAPRRKYWKQQVYLPKILEGRIAAQVNDKITIGE